MPLTIAVADDNSDGRDSLALLLQVAGHVVHCEPEGHGALRCLEANRPDVAILDIGMPGMTGLEVVAAAKAQSWGKDIVFIAVSGYTTKKDLEAAKAAGFDFYLTKPHDLAALTAILAQIEPRNPA